jgi:hypothetical protein
MVELYTMIYYCLSLATRGQVVGRYDSTTGNRLLGSNSKAILSIRNIGVLNIGVRSIRGR